MHSTNTPRLPQPRHLPFWRNTQNPASGKEPSRSRAPTLGPAVCRWGQLTFAWLGSPGLLPSGGFEALLSTRGLTTWRKGLHRGKPLTLIPSER